MDKMSRDELVEMYRPDVERLVYFLPWLEGKTGKDVTTSYEADEHHATLAFPVYDEILLGFLNELSSTIFMDTNYQYVYAKYRIRGYKEELALIEKADIMSMDILKGIFSKYVLGGMTKAYLWTQGIEYKIFESAVKRAKYIIEFWSVPIEVRTIDMDLAERAAAEAAEREAAEREAALAAEQEAAEQEAAAKAQEVAVAAETVAADVGEATETTEAAAEAEAPAPEQTESKAAESPEETTEQAEAPAEEVLEAEPEKKAPVIATEVELVRGAEDVLVRDQEPAAPKKPRKPRKKTTKKTAEQPEAAEAAAEQVPEESAKEEAPAAPKKPRKPRKKTTKKTAGEEKEPAKAEGKTEGEVEGK